MVDDAGKGVFSRSIPELISQLRTSFRSKEFDEVEAILVCRERRLKKELEKKKKENELLRNEKASIEAELEEVKEKAEELLKLLDNDGNSTMFELRDRSKDLELSKKRVEDEFELLKNRFEELGSRVSILETKKLPNITNRDLLNSMRIEPPPENVSATVESSGNGVASDALITIIDGDDEFPAKASKSSGKDVEDEPVVLKRKRALFDKA